MNASDRQTKENMADESSVHYLSRQWSPMSSPRELVADRWCGLAAG